MFFVLRRNSRWPPKNGGKMIFGKQLQMTLCIHCGLKTLLESLYRSPFPRYIYIFCRISRWPPKMAGKRLWRTVADDCVYPVGQKFRQNRSIWHRFQDTYTICRISRWPPKMVGKRFLANSCRRLCVYHGSQKFHWNRSIWHRFQNT